MRRKLVAVAVAALAPVAAMLGYNEYAIRSQRNAEVRAQAAQAPARHPTKSSGSSRAFIPC
jgi:hypothetical protein